MGKVLNLSISCLVVAFIGLQIGTAFGQDSFAIFDKDEKGPYSVGFRSCWDFDRTRSYSTAFDEGETYGKTKSPRPILINLWYPARPKESHSPMKYGDYLTGIRSPGELRRLSERLSDFATDIVARETLGKSQAELSEDETAKLNKLFEAPTCCYLDCEPAKGVFPIVVYHSGAGSSFDDNSAFCELVASHGYVVIGSAFLKGHGGSLNTDGSFDSAADMAFLVEYAAEHASGDWNHVGLVGHSLGAQAILHYSSDSSDIADAVVLLDTTLDAYGNAITAIVWPDLVERTLKNIEAHKTPMLVTAGPGASFRLVDKLKGANRTYLTVPHLGHNDFICQGIFHHFMTAGTEQKENDSVSKSLEDARPPVKNLYRALCAYVLAYLNAELKNQRQTLDELNQQIAEHQLGEDSLHVEFTDVGQTGPAPYSLESDVPPTPRQFPALVESFGVKDTVAVLQRFNDHQPPLPIYSGASLVDSTLFELVQKGQVDDARYLHQFLAKHHRKTLSTLKFLGNALQMREFLEAVIAIDPSDATVTDKLQEMKK